MYLVVQNSYTIYQITVNTIYFSGVILEKSQLKTMWGIAHTIPELEIDPQY